MAVEVLPPVVVDGRRPWIGVAGSDLDVPERDSGIQGRHDERCPEHVGIDDAEPSLLADRADPAMGRAPIQAHPIPTTEDGAF